LGELRDAVRASSVIQTLEPAPTTSALWDKGIDCFEKLKKLR